MKTFRTAVYITDIIPCTHESHNLNILSEVKGSAVKGGKSGRSVRGSYGYYY